MNIEQEKAREKGKVGGRPAKLNEKKTKETYFLLEEQHENWALIWQERLNPLVHKGKLNMADIGNHFVSASNDRQNRFGKFDVN